MQAFAGARPLTVIRSPMTIAAPSAGVADSTMPACASRPSSRSWVFASAATISSRRLVSISVSRCRATSSRASICRLKSLPIRRESSRASYATNLGAR